MPDTESSSSPAASGPITPTNQVGRKKTLFQIRIRFEKLRSGSKRLICVGKISNHFFSFLFFIKLGIIVEKYICML